MSLKINKYIDRLLNLKNPSPAKDKHPHWISHHKHCSYVENPKSSFFTTKKIERVLSQLDTNFKKFDNSNIDLRAYENLEKLIGLVQYNVQNYKSKHSKVYLIFSKIFFGDIDHISQKLTEHLETLRLRYPHAQPPLHVEPNNPVPVEAAALVNKIKSSRLKFYELFAERLQTPGAEEKEALLRLPIVDITSRGMAIRLPRELLANGFDVWLEQQLNERQIQFGKKNVVMDFEGIRLTKEITLTLEEADKLDIPNIGLGHLQKLIGGPELNLVHYHKHLNMENEPHIENTIAINLARLDPHLHPLLAAIKSHPLPQIPFPVPFVKFDDQGMMIQIADSDNNLKELLQQIFAFKGEPIEEVHFSRPYNYMFRLPRDEVEIVLKQLGMDKIPPDQLSARFANGEITYLQHLTETKRLHVYKPVSTNDALESIADSLELLVPNEMHAKPLVSCHPRGWVSIKIAEGNEAYVQSLASYLKCPFINIQQQFNHNNYQHEIIIHEEMLPQFLKKLKLENTPEGASYLEQIQDLAGQHSLEVFYAETDNLLDLRRTISRTLSALSPDCKVILKDYSPQDYPETLLPLIDVNYIQDQIDIKIPKTLNDTLIPIGLDKSLAFGPYLSHIFGIPGQIEREYDGQEFYHIVVPSERTKNFLEKELSLRILPQKYQRKETEVKRIENEHPRRLFDNFENEHQEYINNTLNLVTFYNQFQLEQNRNNPHGNVADLSLRNPSIPMPEQIPQIDEKTFIKNARNILSGHVKKESYIAVFIDTFERITPGHISYRKGKTADAIQAYLSLIMHELMHNHTLAEDRKRAALIDIGETCHSGTCMPGRLGKIQDAYQNLMQPEFADKVKSTLLDKVEKFKNGLLSEIFKNEGQSVHYVARAKKDWGREFGLDVEGNRDEHYGHSSEEKKEEFREACKANLASAVFDLVLNDKDAEGAITNLGDYQARLRQILCEEGLKPDEIDAEMQRFCPEQEVETPQGKKYIASMIPEAITKLLIDIGVLFP